MFLSRYHLDRKLFPFLSVFITAVSPDTYTVNVVRLEPSADSSTFTKSTLLIVTRGSQSLEIVKNNVTPKFTETVENDETFHLEFITPNAFSNGFCYVQVTVELPRLSNFPAKSFSIQQLFPSHYFYSQAE